VSVTFDGLPANQKTLQRLGGSLVPDNFVSTFPHPECEDLRIAAIFDACHMMKLARTVLDEYQVINIPGVGKAKWQHIQMLHNKQNEEGLTLANKVTKAHVSYKTQKMKVKLAVQVLSSSCARALKFLRTSGDEQFVDSTATELYLERMDKLFDILNCRSARGKGYKSPITASNARSRIAFLKEMKEFLLELEDSNGRKLFQTKRHTFVLGFCTTIDSVISLVDRLILGQGINGIKLKYLLTYKFSQDHIEILFGIVRRRGGWNNNPTALQFSQTYRAILSHVGVVGSANSNVLTDASNDILAGDVDEGSVIFDNSIHDDHSYSARLPSLTPYVDNVCTYMAGFVVRRLLPRVSCLDCRALLVSVSDVPNSCFLRLKDNGGLVTPSKSVVDIVQVAEKNIRALIGKDKPAHAVSRLGLQLEKAVMSDVDFRQVFGNVNHILDSSVGIDNHVYSLVRQIVRFFLDIRRFHLIKSWNIEQRGAARRQSLTKAVLFRNE
jgi:hypothetical protein